MTDPTKLPETRAPKVVKGGHDCEHYQRDGFKAWLVTDGLGRQQIATPPGWMIL